MFLHMLSDTDKEEFLKYATLLSLSDNPLHWDGKSLDELTGNVALDTAEFQEVESEKTVLDGLIQECGKNPSRSIWHVGFGRSEEYVFSEIAKSLLGKLVVLPLRKMEDKEDRIKAAGEVLKEIHYHAGTDLGLPSISKVMLHELMLLALADGEVSTVEGALLKQFAALHKLDDYTYDDLLERAEGMNREASKTLALILE